MSVFRSIRVGVVGAVTDYQARSRANVRVDTRADYAKLTSTNVNHFRVKTVELVPGTSRVNTFARAIPDSEENVARLISTNVQ